MMRKPSRVCRTLGADPSRLKTCVSLLAALDAHPRVAMRILRQSKTMEIHTKAPSDATRDALRKVGDLLA
jgi:hypothetical protein